MGSVLRRNKPDDDADGGRLPTDVLFEVLLCFPANVVCRLRLVCRSWRSLTSDPVFAKAHASRHPLLAGVKIGKDICLFDLSGSVVKRIPIAWPSGALNTQLDVACVTGMFPRCPAAGSLLDLATGKVVAATLLRRNEHRGCGGAAISPFLLGHIPSTGEMKVFYTHMHAAHGEEGDRALQVCSIMTLGDGGNGGRWRVTPSPPAHVASFSNEIVAIKGVAYFLLRGEPSSIAVLDLAAEEWRPETLQGPLSSRLAGDDEKLVYDQYRDHVQLAEVDACLVIVHHNHRQGSSMDLWFLVDMDVDKGLWTKQYTIRSPSRGASYPLLLLDDGRIVIWEELTYALRVYDPRANEWADLATLRNYFSLNMYQGNLLCPGP